MGFGGPVWHTSVSGFGLSNETLRAKALSILQGVGDPALGQWEERGEKAYHIRRRMTAAEAKQVGGVLDIRGSDEAQSRFEKMRRYLPPGWTEIQ